VVCFERRVIVAASKVIVAFAVLTLFVHVQCVGACMAVFQHADAAPAPLCHKHHDHSNSSHKSGCCSPGLAIASATAPDAPQSSLPVAAVALAAHAVPNVPAHPESRVSNSFDTSPPLFQAVSFTILRV
jgi:hypothetical protein